MSNQSLFLIMSVIFAVASNMDYEDAEKLRAANRHEATQTSAVSEHLLARHPA